MPLAFAKELQNAGYAMPRNSVNAHPAGALTLAKDNGDFPIQRLKDGQTANPLDRTGALSRPGFPVYLGQRLPADHRTSRGSGLRAA